MPVQKSRKTPSKRGMHRSHDRLYRSPRCPSIPSRARRTLRHRITPDGFYRGRRVESKPAEAESDE